MFFESSLQMWNGSQHHVILIVIIIIGLSSAAGLAMNVLERLWDPSLLILLVLGLNNLSLAHYGDGKLIP